MDGSVKLLVADDGSEHFYELAGSGVETARSAGDSDAQLAVHLDAQELRVALSERERLTVGREPAPEALSDEQRRELRALGYLAD